MDQKILLALKLAIAVVEVVNRFWPSSTRSLPELPCLEDTEKPRSDELHKP